MLRIKTSLGCANFKKRMYQLLYFVQNPRPVHVLFKRTHVLIIRTIQNLKF